MKLYDYYRSSASYRVRIALNLKKIHYEQIPIHLTQDGGQQHGSHYRTLNPQALVPTLDENNHIITQSIAIIEYLDEMCPSPPLLPSTPLGKATVRSLALSIACDIHPLNNLRVLQTLRSEFNAKDEQINAWYHHWLKLGFDAIELNLQDIPRKESVCYGQNVSLADICLIPQVYNAQRYQFSLKPYPIIHEIFNYCMSFPEFIDAAPENQCSHSK